MGVDTTVVETDIHYPADSTLLGDGVRVLTRIMKRVSAVAGQAGAQMRNRSRSTKLRILAIARASRNKTGARPAEDEECLPQTIGYHQPSGRASQEVFARDRQACQGNLSVLDKAKTQLNEMIPRTANEAELYILAIPRNDTGNISRLPHDFKGG